jgi:S-sulfo-L-cysteine synthase (O-acetyl-L-serine-dependent)
MLTSIIPSRPRTTRLPLGVGNTPLVPLPSAALGLRPQVEVALKCEHCNLGGSSKARAAEYMLRAAVAKGRWAAGRALLVPTSGNTGLACAAAAARFDIATFLVMAENVSPERLEIARALGAQVALTPANEGSDGAYRRAQQMLAEAPDSFCLIDQYRDPANWLAHYETTGPEIWAQTRCRITHFVAGIGTTGTIVGAGRYLKACNPNVRIVGVEPAAVTEAIPGLRYLGGSMVPEIYDPAVIDDHIFVTSEEAKRGAALCACEAGMTVGPSAGAALAGALALASRLTRGLVVVLAPDGIEKYLSGRPNTK